MSNDNINKVKIQAWIPNSLWEQIEAKGYTNKTQAVIEAFEMMLGQRENNDVSNSDQIDQTEIKVLKMQVEGLQMVLGEKEKVIEARENGLKKADQDKEDLKQMHNNYFLQVQTLINQKAIGSPKESRE